MSDLGCIIKDVVRASNVPYNAQDEWFDPNRLCNDVYTGFPSEGVEVVNWEELKLRADVTIPHFKEIIAVWSNYEEGASLDDAILKASDSYTLQNFRGHPEQHSGFVPIAVLGMIETSDGYVIIGERDGATDGKWQAAPGGSVTWVRRNPIGAAFYEECFSELGFYSSYELPLGHFFNDDTSLRGIKPVMLGRVNETFQEVQEKHLRGRNRYEILFGETGDKQEARNRLAEEAKDNDFVADSWEYVSLFPIHPDGILGFIKNETKERVETRAEGLLGIGLGPLVLYGMHKHGNEFYDEAKKVAHGLL